MMQLQLLLDEDAAAADDDDDLSTLNDATVLLN